MIKKIRDVIVFVLFFFAGVGIVVWLGAATLAKYNILVDSTKEVGLLNVFPVAEDDEFLIIVLLFSPKRDSDISHAIFRQTLELPLTSVRVELLDEYHNCVVTDDLDGVAKIAKHYNASVVVWGCDTFYMRANIMHQTPEGQFIAKNISSSDDVSRLRDKKAYVDYVVDEIVPALMGTIQTQNAEWDSN